MSDLHNTDENTQVSIKSLPTGPYRNGLEICYFLCSGKWRAVMFCIINTLAHSRIQMANIFITLE